MKFWVYAPVVVLLALLGLNEARSGGFHFAALRSTLPFDPALEPPFPSQEEEEEVICALSQRFSFLSAGRQSYVFCSQDGRYVLKFFRRASSPPSPLSLLLSQSALLSRESYRVRKVTNELKGTKIAYDTLKEESALVWIHLNKTAVTPHTVTVTDLLGLPHTMQLADKEFVLQRKADLFYAYIDEEMRAGHTGKAQEAIRSAVQLLLKEFRSGLKDEDPAFHRNLGCIDARAILIDVGRVKQKERAKSSAYIAKKIPKVTRKCKQWLQDHHPLLVPYLDEQIQLAIQEV